MQSLKYATLVSFTIAMAALSQLSNAQSCGEAQTDTGIRVLGDAVLFSSPVLNVDADGAPHAYLVNGKGLSYTCDGVVALEAGKRVTPDSDPKNWQTKCNAAWALAKTTNDYSRVAIFGFQTDKNNRPVVQAAGDPLPGKAYISATTVPIPDAPDGTQRRYVNAVEIPYVVLPPSFVSKYRVKPGSVAIVYRKKTDKYAFAVFADGGRLGEASIKLHQDLGNNPISVIAGVARAKKRIEDSTLVVVFPKKIATPMSDSQVWINSIKLIGASALEVFGGVEQLHKCAKD